MVWTWKAMEYSYVAHNSCSIVVCHARKAAAVRFSIVVNGFNNDLGSAAFLEHLLNNLLSCVFAFVLCLAQHSSLTV